jgi:anti-sigma factor RsiW
MNPNPLPDNWRSLLAGYVLDDLTEAETAEVQSWLTHYPEVAAELAALEGSWQAIPESLPRQSPPPQLRDRLLTAGQSAPATLPVPDPPRPPQPSPTSARLGLGRTRTGLGRYCGSAD